MYGIRFNVSSSTLEKETEKWRETRVYLFALRRSCAIECTELKINKHTSKQQPHLSLMIFTQVQKPTKIKQTRTFSVESIWWFQKCEWFSVLFFILFLLFYSLFLYQALSPYTFESCCCCCFSVSFAFFWLLSVGTHRSSQCVCMCMRVCSTRFCYKTLLFNEISYSLLPSYSRNHLNIGRKKLQTPPSKYTTIEKKSQ